MELLSNKYFIIFIRILISFIFIFSGIEKITAPDKFAEAITNYKLFPLFSVNIIAIIIPWLELFAGGILLFGFWGKENAIILNVLLIAFTLLVAVSMFRGLDINCGCFGTKYAQKVGLLKIGENILLIAITYVIYKFGKTQDDNAD